MPRTPAELHRPYLWTQESKGKFTGFLGAWLTSYLETSFAWSFIFIFYFCEEVLLLGDDPVKMFKCFWRERACELGVLWPPRGVEVGMHGVVSQPRCGVLAWRHGTLPSDSVTQASPPRWVLQAQQSKSSFSFLVLICWGSKDNNTIKCRSSTCGPQGTMELTTVSLWSGRRPAEPAEPQRRVMSVPPHVVSVTLSSAFVVWQPPETGCKCMVWLCFRKTLNFKEFSQVME